MLGRGDSTPRGGDTYSSSRGHPHFEPGTERSERSWQHPARVMGSPRSISSRIGLTLQCYATSRTAGNRWKW